MDSTHDRIESRKLWFDFAKFFLGTFTVGLISLLVTSNLKEKEVAMLALEKEHLELKMFMSVAAMPLEQKRAFSIYFSTVARDAQLRRVWADYRRLVETEIATELEARKQKRIAIAGAIRGMYTGLQKVFKENPPLRQRFFDYLQATLRPQDRDDPAISALLETLSTGGAASTDASN